MAAPVKPVKHSLDYIFSSPPISGGKSRVKVIKEGYLNGKEITLLIKKVKAFAKEAKANGNDAKVTMEGQNKWVVGKHIVDLTKAPEYNCIGRFFRKCGHKCGLIFSPEYKKSFEAAAQTIDQAHDQANKSTASPISKITPTKNTPKAEPNSAANGEKEPKKTDDPEADDPEADKQKPNPRVDGQKKLPKVPTANQKIDPKPVPDVLNEAEEERSRSVKDEGKEGTTTQPEWYDKVNEEFKGFFANLFSPITEAQQGETKPVPDVPKKAEKLKSEDKPPEQIALSDESKGEKPKLDKGKEEAKKPEKECSEGGGKDANKEKLGEENAAQPEWLNLIGSKFNEFGNEVKKLLSPSEVQQKELPKPLNEGLSNQPGENRSETPAQTMSPISDEESEGINNDEHNQRIAALRKELKEKKAELNKCSKEVKKLEKEYSEATGRDENEEKAYAENLDKLNWYGEILVKLDELKKLFASQEISNGLFKWLLETEDEQKEKKAKQDKIINEINKLAESMNKKDYCKELSDKAAVEKLCNQLEQEKNGCKRCVKEYQDNPVNKVNSLLVTDPDKVFTLQKQINAKKAANAALEKEIGDKEKALENPVPLLSDESESSTEYSDSMSSDEKTE